MSQVNAKSLSRLVRRTRQKTRREPEIPVDNTFELPTEYTVTSNGKEFLVDDNSDPNYRILIFAAEWSLDLLEQSEHWGVNFNLKCSKFLF